jgi:ribonucleoside-diphosphate reductase alpha chain
MFGKRTSLSTGWKRLAKILSIKNQELEGQLKNALTYRPPPDECESITHKVTIGGKDVYIVVANYPEGMPCKIILYIGKMGHEESVYKATVETLSLALQFGCPLESFIDEYKHHRMGIIEGATSNPAIPMAHSVIDYLGKWLELKYIEANERNGDEQEDKKSIGG